MFLEIRRQGVFKARNTASVAESRNELAETKRSGHVPDVRKFSQFFGVAPFSEKSSEVNPVKLFNEHNWNSIEN